MAFSDKQMREGRARLATLKDAARFEAFRLLTDPAVKVETPSMLGHSVFSRLKPENLDALILHRGVKGWYADVVLKGMPAGIASVFGTPTKHPLPTRAAAEEAGRQMLQTVFRVILEREQGSHDMAPKDTRPFELYGVTYSIPGALIDGIKPMMDAMPVEFTGTPDSVSERLMARVRPFVNEKQELDLKGLETLPQQESMAILANMATLLCMGVFRLPGRTPDPLPDKEDGPRMN